MGTWKLQERLKVILTVTLVVQLTLIMLLMHGNANTANNANYATSAGTASNSNQLGGKDAAQYVVKGDFAVVTGTLIADGSTADTDISYPSGFNSTNSVLISAASVGYTSSQGNMYTTGHAFDSVSYVRGGLGFSVTLMSNLIRIRAKNVVITKTDSGLTGANSPLESGKSIKFRLVLMKV